jgi:ABC-2 type transport system ATP-binding protein
LARNIYSVSMSSGAGYRLQSMRTEQRDLAIETEDLVKTFGATRAVDGISLSVRTGTVYGVLGPNGAGKTTTMRMLATLLRPDSGTARVLGRDVVTEGDAVRAGVSLTGQFASVDDELNGRENLVLLARLLGFSRSAAAVRARELLDAFGLTDAADRLVREYSGGMRRRLDIAASIVVTPELLFLDEPTTGLDPRSRNQVWDIVRALVAEGTTVLLTTQYLDEADQLADRIAIIDHGKVIAEGTSAELKALVGSGTLHLRLLDPDERALAVRLVSDLVGAPMHPDTDPTRPTGPTGPTGDPVEPLDPAVLSFRAPDPERATLALAELAQAGVRLAEFSLGQPSMDEVFLALTGTPVEPVTAEDAA